MSESPLPRRAVNCLRKSKDDDDGARRKMNNKKHFGIGGRRRRTLAKKVILRKQHITFRPSPVWKSFESKKKNGAQQTSFSSYDFISRSRTALNGRKNDLSKKKFSIQRELAQWRIVNFLLIVFSVSLPDRFAWFASHRTRISSFELQLLLAGEGEGSAFGRGL